MFERAVTAMLICYWGLIWLLPRISKMLRGGIVFFIFFPFFFFPLLFQVKHTKKLPGHSSIKDAICKTQDMKENKNTEKKKTQQSIILKSRYFAFQPN